MYVLVRAGLYPGLSVYCLLLTASPVLQSICSGVREILFCTSVFGRTKCVCAPTVCFVLYCILQECVCSGSIGPPKTGGLGKRAQLTGPFLSYYELKAPKKNFEH